MTSDQCRAINEERLADWAATLTRCHATPLLLIGVGHDAGSGGLHLCIPEGQPELQSHLPALLRKAARMIEEGRRHERK